MSVSKSQKPLYSVIKDELQSKIDQGDYQPDQQLPTENELSSLYSVSRITTRRALEELEREGYIYRIQGSGSFVKRAEAAPERQTPAPLSFAEVEPGPIISMILPHLDEGAMVGYIRGASDYLNRLGYHLSVHTSNSDPALEEELLESMPGRGSSAVILYPLNDSCSFERLNRLYLMDFPIVTIDKEMSGMPIPSVVSDNFGGVYEAVSRLIDLGHRRIAFFSNAAIESVSSVRSRYFGYCKAMKDRGVPILPELVRLGANKELKAAGKTAFFSGLLNGYRENGITAVQVENDLIAVQLLLYAQQLDMRIPDDLSIFGFDNNPICEMLHIPVATVGQNYDEIGRTAAELLIRRLRQGQAGTGQHVVPVSLIERKSVHRLA